MPPARAGAYIAAATLLAMTQGFGMNLVTANIPQIQGAIGATVPETTWLVAAYMAPNVSLSLALIKIRNQYGLRNFAELSILCFVLASLLNFFVSDLQSALIVRFMSGIAASPMSSLAFLYMLEPFPPARKMNLGLSLALTNISLGVPLSRLISPWLLDIGQWHGLTMLELGLALTAFGAVYLLPLTSPPRAKVIEKLDVVSYLLIATGFGATAIVLVLGQIYWWLEAPWVGELLVLAIVCVTAAAIIELHRENPLIDVRWLASPAIVHFAGALLVFRIILSEQAIGASSFFQMLGFTNAQTHSLYAVILLATVLGGLLCATILKPGREPKMHAVALVLLATGALMDSRATNLTRPENVYLSQALIALASALYLPPALASGLMSALKKGPNYILSFVIIFLTTQSLGGLLGSAVFNTFITAREKFHSNSLVEHLVMTDPLVAKRVTDLGAAYGRVVQDPTLLNAEGVALLAQQVTREANVLAYNDAFLLVAILSLTALTMLLIHMAIDLARSRMAVAEAPAGA